MYPSTLDDIPNVSTGQIITSNAANVMINAINAIELALQTNPFGPYASVAAAIAGKLDLSGGTMTGTLNMGGRSLTGLPAPVSSSDAATKAYVDSSNLALAVDYEGTTQGTRREVNFIPSGNATVSVVDNPGSNRVDITLGGLGGGSSGVATIFEDLGCVIDGGGATPASSTLYAFRRVDFACTIVEVDIIADQSGSAVIDIWKDTLAHFPLTSTASICGTNYPTLSSQQTSAMTSFTGWSTTTINQGDILGFFLQSASTVTRLTIVLKVQRAINTLGNSVVSVTETIGICLDGNGGVPTPGLSGGAFRRVDYAGNINAWTLIGNGPGNVQLDVWKTDLAGIPTIGPANSITGGNPPTITGAQTAYQTNLSGWTVGFAPGDIFAFNLISINNMSRVVLALTVTRT